jgi:hypothetical protein
MNVKQLVEFQLRHGNYYTCIKISCCSQSVILSAKITVVWDETPCSLVDISYIRGNQLLHSSGWNGNSRFPERIVNTRIIQTTRRHIPEDRIFIVTSNKSSDLACYFVGQRIPIHFYTCLQ